MVTDQSQAVVWQTEQTPFGEVTQTTGTLAQPLRFPGQYADPETGYSYNYFRDYDPSVGRYVQSDPIGLAGGVNTYGYVINNPISLIDPLGLIECTCQAQSSGGVGYIDDVKQCRYRCRTRHGEEREFDAPGRDHPRGDFCFGASVGTTITPSGDLTNFTDGLNEFEVDTGSFFDRNWNYSSDFTNAVDDAFSIQTD